MSLHTHTHTHTHTWSLKEPLISSNSLCSVVLLEVQHGPQPQRGVGGDHLELGDHLFQYLTRIEGEWLLSETYLLVSVAKLDLKTIRYEVFKNNIV